MLTFVSFTLYLRTSVHPKYLITYSSDTKLFVVLFIQHVKRMSLIILSVACPAVHNFSALSHKWHDFRRSYGIENVFRFSLQILSEIFFILTRI